MGYSWSGPPVFATVRIGMGELKVSISIRRTGLPADPRSLSLAEVLGNLIENAALHARSRVRIDARQDGQDFIEDDGPGVTGTWNSFECDLARFDALGLG